MSRLKKRVFAIPLAILIVIGVGTIVNASIEKGNITEEIEQLKEEKYKLKRKIYEDNQLLIEEFAKNKTLSITLQDIVTKVNVHKDYCVNLKVTEECFFIEFVSNSEFSQGIVPFNEDSLWGAENGLQLKYYQLSDEEYNLYIEQFELAEERFEDNKVFPSKFVVGDSLFKQQAVDSDLD